MLKIGKLKLKSNLILAPMAGITDLPYRMLCRKFGAELAFVEMINCRSISYKNKRTKQMLSTLPADKPLGVQILGCEEQYILKSLEVLRNYKFDILDFNAACPAKKIVRRGEGSGLLREPEKFAKLLKLVVKKSWLPVSVKIRLGWDKDSVNAREAALYAQDAGIDGLFIHGRTRMQGYSGSVDYGVIRDVKKAVRIPVIASGDMLSPQLAKKMFDETGCDGVAIARGALGNPWLFRNAREFLEKGTMIKRQGIDEILKTMAEHLSACVNFYGEKNGVVIFRKFFNWYTRGFRKIRPFREKSSRVKTEQQMASLIQACCRLQLRFLPESKEPQTTLQYRQEFL